ncbi:hypothetical protein SLOPH_629 [Spraguea lophii 42_110]|uniref:Uncharacterized protein n=1 Tax=Spraguea lophii (strain 42_110) TaxID=1358809 RepID=S7XL34_SPRLO|nr:hypothetical protein SLOPH_629 [Spraguea lophii 42_110]
MFISENASEYLSRYSDKCTSFYPFTKTRNIIIKEKKARGFYKKPRWNISVVAKEYIPYRTVITEIEGDIYMDYEYIKDNFYTHPEMDIKIVYKDEIMQRMRAQCRSNVALCIIKEENSINKKNIENRENNKKYKIYLIATDNIMEDEELIFNIKNISNGICSCNKIEYCLQPV